jgi:hypothetical protein
LLVAVFVLTALTATASWFLLERPILRFKDPKPLTAPDPAVVAP